MDTIPRKQANPEVSKPCIPRMIRYTPVGKPHFPGHFYAASDVESSIRNYVQKVKRLPTVSMANPVL